MKPSQKKSREKNSKKCIKRKIYTEENLQKALHEISKGMSKKLAAKTFSVPRSTIQFRLKHPDHRSKPGPSTILTDEEEQLFVDWIKISSKKGFPKRKEDLIKSVSDFINKSGRASSFKNGEKWFKLFLARHPTVTFRTPEAVTAASSTVSASDVRGWFEQIRIYMTENSYYDILADPSRVFNGDETNFVLCPKTGIVLRSKGEKNVYEIDHAQAKTSLTVMFTFGADGQVTPPMVIFPYKRLPGEITSKIPEDWGVGLSDNGWMNSDVFFEYIKNVLHPHLVRTGTQFPVVLFVDGHKSHLTYATSELCTNLGIILIALYPNCTRLLQPADVSAFKPLKTQWQKTVLEWRRNNPSQALTKTQFVPLLKDTIEKSLNPSTIINGFRATGLCPFNEDAVDYSKCLGTSNKNNITIAQPKHVTDNRVLTKDDFMKLLGESAIHKIDTRELRPEESSECLLKIWNFFTTSQNDLQNSSIFDTERQNDNIGNFDIENMDIIINNSPNKNVAEQSFDFVSQDVVVEEIVQCSELNYFIEDIPTLQEPIPETVSQQPHNHLSSTQQAFNQPESIEKVSFQKASTSLQHTSILQPSFTYVSSNKQLSTQQTFVQQTSTYQASVSSQQQSSIYSTPQKPSIRVTGDDN